VTGAGANSSTTGVWIDGDTEAQQAHVHNGEQSSSAWLEPGVAARICWLTLDEGSASWSRQGVRIMSNISRFNMSADSRMGAKIEMFGLKWGYITDTSLHVQGWLYL
jgi:hypothetical protein